MSAIRGTYRSGEVVLDAAPSDWKDGERLSVAPAPAGDGPPADGPFGLRDEDWPTTPDGIAGLLAAMDEVEGPFLSPEDEAEWNRVLADRKAWELANWDRHSKKIGDLFR